MQHSSTQTHATQLTQTQTQTQALTHATQRTQATHATQLTQTQTHPTQTHARNAVDADAPDASANARSARKQRTPQKKKQKNASHTRCTTSTVFCVLKACMLITFCQRMLAFLLYKRLHRRCRKRRYRFWVKEIGRSNCLPSVIIPKIIFRRFCIHRVGYSHIGVGTRARN